MKRIFSVAPMMDYTDRHFRFLARLLSPNAWLYTEMIHANAIIHGDTTRFLAHHPSEYPLAIPLGGCEPKKLAAAAKIAEEHGFNEINLNIGCPSDRVQKGRFGACLMREPELVAECVATIKSQVKLPVTVKTRLGVDNDDSLAFLVNFLEIVTSAGCQTFILHARKAWLKGLNPKQNRSIPPLNYQRVYDIKKRFPELEIIINGGIETIEAVNNHLQQIDGVMLGRKAYHQPFLLRTIESVCFATPPISLSQVFEKIYIYMQTEITKGTPMQHISRHISGLFLGQANASHWRRNLAIDPLKTLHFAINSPKTFV
ncbi:MAG: tRNA dihydrouridine(20/20a) synthase DusA, partial [Pseudomonadota bacterium]